MGSGSCAPSPAGFQRKDWILGYLHCDTLCQRELNTEDPDYCVVNRAVDVWNVGGVHIVTHKISVILAVKGAFKRDCIVQNLTLHEFINVDQFEKNVSCHFRSEFLILVSCISY